MDSQERHDLKENDLAEFFQNFGEWWAKWGNTVLIVFVLVAGSFAAYRLVSYRSEMRHETAWGELAAATTAAQYMDVAASHEQPAVQVLAYLRGGDLYLAHARLPADAPTPRSRNEELPPPVDVEMPAEEAAQRAEQAYGRVMELADEPTFRVNALLGLAAVAETHQAWDEAAEHYDAAAELAGDVLPGLARTARQRRELLPAIRQPVVFAPARSASPMPALPGLGGASDPFDISELLDFETPITPRATPAASESSEGEPVEVEQRLDETGMPTDPATRSSTPPTPAEDADGGAD
ncbi:MAG: hypothetical protein WD009_03225 [Phycisphaeraceae bacterium]